MQHSTAHELLTIAPGTVLAERFEVERCLGFGSMAVVYLCRDLRTKERLALKVLQPASPLEESRSTYRTRFRVGVRIAQNVEHPRVARVLEYIDRPDLTACVMEYVDGPDLASKLSQERQLAVSEVLRLLRQITEGVQAIHDCGIVHRDLKPANILLKRGRDVKITDFGIARSEKTPRLTAQGGVVGTIPYLSPESLKGEHVDERSDIYAIGVIGYELITGTLPFHGANIFAAVERKIQGDAVPPCVLNPHCPERLSDIILKAMHRDPDQRYRYALQLQQDLDALASQLESDPNFAPTRPLPLREDLHLAERQRAKRFDLSALLLASILLLCLSSAVWLSLPPPAAPSTASEVGSSSSLSHEPELSGQSLSTTATQEIEPPVVPGVRAPAQRQTLLYRFADFVEWPVHAFPDKTAPLRICLLGPAGIGIEFDRIVSHSRLSDGRSMWVQRFAGTPQASLLATCQVLYVAGIPAGQSAAILEPLRHMPILSITDGTGQGIIDFVPGTTDSTYVVYEDRAAAAELRLSPVLLDLSAARNRGQE